MRTSSRYVSESKDEGDRLLIKTDREEVRFQLETVHLPELPPRARLIDAGCGVGIVSEVMYELLGNKRRPAAMHLLDLSPVRALAAYRRLAQAGGETAILATACDLMNIPLPDAHADFIFCRFVFEYIRQPQLVLNEFVRVLKPGGKVVVADLDNCSIAFNPIDEVLESDFKRMFERIRIEDFDTHVGRKLFSFFKAGNLCNIKVHVQSHNLVCGRADEPFITNWAMKLDKIGAFRAANKVDFGFDFPQFKERFMRYLHTPGIFSYTPFLMVEGVKG